MSREVSTEDLLVLSRQCKLSEEEEKRLAIARQASRELECLYNAGLHFDAEAGLLSGDELRCSRLVARTLERLDQNDGVNTPRTESATRKAASRPSRVTLIARYFAASLAFGVLLCVTLASAWDYVEKRAAQRALLAEQAQRTEQAKIRKQRAHAASHELEPKAPAPAAVPAVPVPASASPLIASSATPARPLPLPIGHKTAASDEPLSPSELFARANQARRTGDIEDAISLYERLGRAYPNSLEAQDAKILRGNLLLSQRSPRAALRQFEDYHSGALSLEALWGRAQALRKLQSPEERPLLLELVRDYPDSPYAEAAKKRLRELAP